MNAGELCDRLCSVLQWPEPRDVRLLAGSADTEVTRVVLCADVAEAEEAVGPGDALVLVLPTHGTVDYGEEFRAMESLVQRMGERKQVVIEASEPVRFGACGLDEQLGTLVDPEGFEPEAAVAAEPTFAPPLVKFVGFVPEGDAPSVRAAMFEAGGGVIGDYDHCSWSTAGTGTFRPQPGANPAIGSVGADEQVDEQRIEVICQHADFPNVYRAFVTAHPYEEPACDAYPLMPSPRIGKGRQLVGADLQVATICEHLARSMPGVTPRVHAGLTDRRALAAPRVVLASTVDLWPGWVAAPADILVCADNDEHHWIDFWKMRGTTVVGIPGEPMLETVLSSTADSLTRHLGLPVVGARAHSAPPEHAAASATSDSPARAAQQQMAMDTITSASNVHDNRAVPTQLWFDGGARGNPGPAAAAWVLRDAEGDEIERDSLLLGSTTNNVAEYQGLVNGLRHALERGAGTLEIFSDSELVVKQVRGEYKVKHAGLKLHYQEASDLLARLDSFTISHVRREQNHVADQLVNDTLDAAAG